MLHSILIVRPNARQRLENSGVDHTSIKGADPVSQALPIHSVGKLFLCSTFLGIKNGVL